MAYDFNGTSQWLSALSAPVTAMPLTLACWFNSDSTTTNQRLIGLYNDGSTYFDLGIRGADAGDPVAIVANQSGTVQITSTTTGFSANTWHHACGVFTSSTSRTVYIDGGSSATGTTDITPAGIDELSIARFWPSSPSVFQYLDGRLAEVGIWNAALTAAEVASLAKGMTCDKVRPQSLVAYFPLVRNLVELKAGLTITNNNTATVANHPRVYA
jgi:hypothetical protein